MTMTEQERADFETAMGESFAAAVCPPVLFEDASPHECCEAIRSVLGPQVTPQFLAALSGAELVRLADDFGHYFQAPSPSVTQIEAGIAFTLARWPAPRAAPAARHRR
ncbi:hypothetical protein [Roseomonas sp. WA12]